MKSEISYEDFAKLDLKIATILEAKPHPNADKLVVLQIDLGTEKRQIVAGIKPSYSTEDLVNKQITVITNLKPITLRGEESNGMLLAATNEEGKPILITPDQKVHSGAEIK